MKKCQFFELLPPAEDSWHTIVPRFLDRARISPVWSAHRTRLQGLLSSTSPRPGNLVQVTMDELSTDRLGGRQRLQISVLYFKWRTEEFRTVSSGWVSIRGPQAWARLP